MATHQPDAQRDKAEPGLHRNNVRSSSRMRMVIALTIIIPFLNVIPNLSSPPIFPSFKLASSKLLENSLLSNDRQKPPLDSCDINTEPCYKYLSSKLLEIFLSCAYPSFKFLEIFLSSYHQKPFRFLWPRTSIELCYNIYPSFKFLGIFLSSDD